MPPLANYAGPQGMGSPSNGVNAQRDEKPGRRAAPGVTVQPVEKVLQDFFQE
jgi:hypothetical protein